MQIIPVIDLKDGLVVHAKQGRRNDYAPVNSPLCRSAHLDEVIQAFLALYPFQLFYIADLNAITGESNHRLLLEKLLFEYPDKRFWIDSGYQQSPSAYAQRPNYLPVLGTESYTEATVAVLHHFAKQYVLSLDFAGATPLGAESLFNDVSCWPQRLIIMNLQQVGSEAGPDLNKLSNYQQRHPTGQVIAAGGVRDVRDLQALQRLGIHSALIASALHNGKLGTHDLHALAAECTLA